MIFKGKWEEEGVNYALFPVVVGGRKMLDIGRGRENGLLALLLPELG